MHLTDFRVRAQVWRDICRRCPAQGRIGEAQPLIVEEGNWEGGKGDEFRAWLQRRGRQTETMLLPIMPSVAGPNLRVKRVLVAFDSGLLPSLTA